MTPRNESGGRSVSGEAQPVEQRSTATLLTDIVNQISELFRKELQLFRAELDEKTNQAFAAIGSIVAGLVLALVALNALAAALIAGIAALGISEGWSALIVGVVIAVVAYVLVSSGTKNLKAARLAPNRTAESLRKDAEVARESTR